MNGYQSHPLQPLPESWPRQQTASGLLLQSNRVLLERRPDNARVTPGVWDSPGGHIKEHETPEQALLRELQEELGIAPLRFRLLGVFDRFEPEPQTLYRHWIYAIDHWDGEVRSQEGREIAWHPWKDIGSLPQLEPILKGLLIASFPSIFSIG